MTPSSARLRRQRLSRLVFIAALVLALAALAGSAMATAGLRVTVTAKPKAISTSATASFGWKSAGKVLHTKCSIDTRKFAACKKSKRYAGLKDGLHRFRVEVLGAGTAHKTATVRWRIDRTAPTVPTVSGGSPAWRSIASVTASAAGSNDAGSGLVGYESRISTDAGVSWSAAAKGASVVTTNQGQTLVEFRAADKAGNRSAWTASATVRIDRDAPTAPAVTGGSPQWQNAATVLVSAADSADAASGVDHYQYRTSIDGGATWSSIANGAQASISADGETLVQFAAVDAAGNVSDWAPSSPTDGSTVRLDRSIPTSPTVTGALQGWQSMASATLVAAGSNDAQGAGVAGYEHRESTDGGTTWTTPAAGATVVVSAEGQTLVQFRAVDNASLDSAWTQAEVDLDRTSPTDPAVTGGSAAWRSLASVDVNASGSTDAGGSGLDHYEYRTSTDAGASWSATTANPDAIVTSEGETVVQYRAVDTAGNVSNWVSATVRLDRTAPTAPVVNGGQATWQNAASVDVTGIDSTDAGGSGFDHYEYRTSVTGGTSWSAPSVGATATVSDEGTTLVQFRAVDGAGNTSAWVPQPATALSTVKLDRTAPTFTTVAGGSLTWKNVTSVNVTASGGADTGGSGFAHYDYRTSVDGGASWSDAAAGSTVAVSAEGETLVQFRAVDNAGNTSAWSPQPATAASTVRIDRSAPTAPAVNGGSSAWQNAASIVLTASGSTDTGSGVAGYQYRTSTDGGSSWSSIFSGPSVTVTAQGETLVQFRALDGGGRASSWVAAYARIDRTAPSDPTLTGGGTAWKSVSSITVTPSGSADTGGSGLAGYSVRTSTNGGNTWTTPAAATSANITAEGDTLVSFQARDTAGNTSNWVQVDARIDRTAPTDPTAVGGGSTSWQNVASVSITGSGATDTGSGLSYQYRTSTDGTNWSAAQPGATVGIAAEGATYVQFRAIDGAGNTSPNWYPSTSGAGNTVKLDRGAPTVPTVAGGSLSWRTSSPVAVTASNSSDSGSGLAGYDYRTSTDGGATWSAISAGATASISTQGTTIVQFRSRDVAGNVSAWTPATAGATNTVMIDTKAPTLATPTGGSSSWKNVGPIVISDVMSDATSGIKTMYVRTSANNSTWSAAAAITSPSYSVATAGATYVEFQAVDNAGNTSAWTSSVSASTAKLDFTAPTIPTVTGGYGATSCHRSVTVSAAGSSDSGSGVAHYDYRSSSDGVNWGTAVLNARSVKETVKGVYYLQFRADDNAGNSSAWAPSPVTTASIACIS